MTKGKGSHVVFSAGCRNFQFVPGFSSPALSSAFGSSKEFSASPGGPWTPSNGPFKGLVICVTGLSKEARKQVQDATEKMGGRYSPDLHLQCTHLVVQSFGGRKFEHAVKHGIKRGLYVVNLSWFLNSAKLNKRLDESLFAVSKTALLNTGFSPEDISFDTSSEQLCLPIRPEESKSMSVAGRPEVQSPREGHKRSLSLKEFNFYLDPSLQEDVQAKVIVAATREGATISDSWYMGCSVTHVVCERDSFLTYVGSICNLVTPLWLLKSLKEHALQRMVQFSADLARHLAFVIDVSHNKSSLQVEDVTAGKPFLALSGPCDTASLQTEREELVKIAKAGVRRRRGPRKQPCRTLPRPITPATLLDNVCWSVTDLPSAAKFYVDKSPKSLFDNDNGLPDATPFFDAYENGNTSGSESEICTQSIRESERQERIYTGVFLTILFPIDRFDEMGPSSRTFFNEKGFSRQQIMEHVYTFYQEFLSNEEMKVAIYTDSKHADKLRALYPAKDSIVQGHVDMKRCEFLGGRRNFEGLKRVSRENTGQVYELWLGS